MEYNLPFISGILYKINNRFISRACTYSMEHGVKWT